MGQSISIKVAGKEYPLTASTPEQEGLMRIAAEDISRLLAKYDAMFPTKSFDDKLIFVALNETMSKLAYQSKLTAFASEVKALKDDTDAYLDGIKKG